MEQEEELGGGGGEITIIIKQSLLLQKVRVAQKSTETRTLEMHWSVNNANFALQ